MREERNADSSMPHFKLGFLNLTKRANGYRADKRNAVQVLQRVSDVCETLVQKCDAHKALILAIGGDKRPLASRRTARLIAFGQSAAAVLEDMSKAIQVPSYNDTDRDLSCLAAIWHWGQPRIVRPERCRLPLPCGCIQRPPALGPSIGSQVPSNGAVHIFTAANR